MENKVTLYIATHNITGKKYFGKTCRWFTKEDLQENYHGSGKHWNNHKNKHGKKDVTMEIYKICSINEADADYVVPIALKFSEENDIVKSKEWANLIPEDGLSGGVKGNKHSEETKSKIALSKLNLTDESKSKMSESAKNRPEVSNQTRNKMRASKLGSSHSEETKSKMSEFSKGKPKSDEHKSNISKAKSGESHHLFGKQLSIEHKTKISESLKGREKSEETRAKLSSSQKGKSLTEEHKANIRIAKSNMPIKVCFYCGKEGKGGNMTRYHFENCKNK